MANSFIYQETQFNTGDKVKVGLNIKEEDKVRTQIFEGLIIAIKGRGDNKSFTVRKIAAGSIGVERILPIASPSINSIELVTKGHVRRAKLYYLRGRIGRRALRVRETKDITVNGNTNSKTNKGTSSRKASQKTAAK